jgi:hypothetical protein
MTITNPDTVAKTLRQNGILEGTKFSEIYRYRNAEGKALFALFPASPKGFCDIYQSPHVHEPIEPLFEGGRMQPDGRKFLREWEQEKERLKAERIKKGLLQDEEVDLP